MPPTSANELTPPAEQVERFRRDLEAITGEAPTPGRMLGLGVSGGPDSMALLLLAAAAYPGAVRAATFNHGLRPEAADEAVLVGALCARLSIPHAILAPPGGFHHFGNLQERARAARYLALAHWAGGSPRSPMHAPWVAVAHQRDDVAETFLMRARRGSGVGGLARMRAARALEGLFADGAMLVRPLLDWSRNELVAIVERARLTVVEDPSNTHPRFDRSRIRALLQSADELPPERLAMAARNLRHAEDALDWAAEREWVDRVQFTPDRVTVRHEGLPYELRRRLALRAILLIREEEDMLGLWRGTGLDRLVATLDSGGTGTIAGVKASAKHAEWRFSAAPARRSH